MAGMCDDKARTDLDVSIPSVATLVNNLITANKSSAAPLNSPVGVEAEEQPPVKFPQLRRFDSSRIAQISVQDYLERLKRFGHFDTAFVVALIYIDRLIAADCNFSVTSRNVHRLLITCTTVAEKYYNDTYYCNTYYANVGGVCLTELNRLEITILYVLMWRLRVSDEEFAEKQRQLASALASASSSSSDELMQEAPTEKPFGQTEKPTGDAQSEPSTVEGGASSASGAQSVDDSDETMDSCSDGDMDSDDAEEAQ
jgi:hypothetical protein